MVGSKESCRSGSPVTERRATRGTSNRECLTVPEALVCPRSRGASHVNELTNPPPFITSLGTCLSIATSSTPCCELSRTLPVGRSWNGWPRPQPSCPNSRHRSQWRCRRFCSTCAFEDAGLVTSHNHGRVRTVSLRPGALDVLHLWLGEQRTPAERQADRLGIRLIRTTAKGT